MRQYLVDFGLLALVVAAQWRLGQDLVKLVAARRSPAAARKFTGILPGIAFLLVAGYLLGFAEIRLYLPFTSPLLAVFSGACQLWLYTSSVVYALYLLFRLASRRIPFDPSRRELVNTAGGVLMASPFLVVGYGAFIERTDFRVREVDLPIAGLPPDLEGLRLLQLTDIHLSPFLSVQDLERVIDAANQTRPHIALVTGDLISSRGDPLDACLRQLARLKSDTGSFGCMGNHEHYSGAEHYAAEQGARLGIRFLRGAAAPLRFGRAVLNCAGVDYQRMSLDRANYLRGAGRLVVPGTTNVLLSHNPDVFPVAAAQGYDLMLSGHTHGGQVNIEIFSQDLNPARFFTPYVYGVYRDPAAGRATAYVSRGIGTIGIPARVGAPPEISLLRLRKG